MKRKKLFDRLAAGILSAAVVLSGFSLPGLKMAEAKAAEPAAPQAQLTVNMDPKANTGDIIHGAAGFLYGVSSEDVPTTNTLVPLKSKILVTKGAVGTEHPYGDALDVAKTFLESGGQQVQMYNSNYYGVFGVTATREQYCRDLEQYICPAVYNWKEAWKKEHGTPEDPKDNIGSQIDIDEAIVYVPINEGTPSGGNFQDSWKAYFESIKKADPKARIAGPNSAGYGWQFTEGQSMRSYIQFCADNNCMPDVITWHELQTNCLRDMSAHMDDFRDIWNKTDWTKYNSANQTEGIPEIPQICINEYAEMIECGMPGKLVNWIARLEDEKITGCLPFWHQANNLNDLAAGANEGNGAWWLYKWYGDMSGQTQPVKTNTSFDALYGVSTLDESKKISTTLLGGFTGDVTVRLENVAKTETFSKASTVHVKVQETMFTGFHGAANDTPVILEGAYPVDSDGSVTVKIPDTIFENAYNITVTQASDDEIVGQPLMRERGTVYEAEKAALSGNASASAADTNPVYYMSNDGSGYKAVDMPTGAVMTYKVNVPADGKYKLDFIYGNGQGTQRNDMNNHNPVNIKQSFALDGKEAETVIMESTLFQTMTGVKTLYYDLTAGEHTVTVKTLDGVNKGMVFHDFVRVTHAGAYERELPDFNKVYEAELADVNRLQGNTDSTVVTESKLSGYSGGGYVTGLSKRAVTKGGGIRNTVVVEESGMYNITLRYQSEKAGKANIYVGNTATTLNRVNQTVALKSGNAWNTESATIYLQKGINVVDIDMNVEAALDYMRVRALPEQKNATTIEAEASIPESLKDSIQVKDSERASGGKYVVGTEGAYSNPDYLEFTYNASADGKYQMQAFHSNEDLAGSHSYNIKATDKYAVVEVNGESDSPKFTLQDQSGLKTYYFADCGDHDPSTVSTGDSLGINNSVTDRMYGDDGKGYKWGLVMETEGEVETPGQGGMVSDDPNDKAVYTNYQKALSNSKDDLKDGKSKTETFRYGHSQSEAGINPRYISYQFELDPGVYDVAVCMGNTWGNGTTPKVTLSAKGIQEVSADYSVAIGTNQEKIMTIDLTNAEKNADNKVELKVKATTTTPTLQMNYIKITDKDPGEQEYIALPPDGQKALAGDQLPKDIYVGELVAGKDWFIDYRNMKNETDRYFFINTFSDDTFREKTITLDLKKGANTIRIYNDNSWNVTYGGTTGTPGTNSLRNYTPNFDKFVITPMTLAEAVKLPETYTIDIAATSGGSVFAEENEVPDGGSYTVEILPDEEKTVLSVLVNGKDKKNDLKYDEKTKTYTLKVDNVKEDQKVQAYFGGDEITKEELKKLYDSCKDLKKGTYSDASWTVFESARTTAAEILKDSDVPQWKLNSAYENLDAAIKGLKDIKGLRYFVDCGDHGVTTVSEGDSMGTYQSVTDHLYGADEKTGKKWGVVDPAGNNTPNGTPRADGVYTRYTWANENNEADRVDGQRKESTFRYAREQDASGELKKLSVDYKFELDQDKTYHVEVCVGNNWGNSSPVNVIANSADDDSKMEIGSNVQIPTQGHKVVAKDKVKTDADGFLTINVEKAKTNGMTINVNYIIIEEEGQGGEPEAEVTGLEITSLPKTTEYPFGGEFDAEGLAVSAVYSDDTKEKLDEDEYEVKLDGFDSMKAGEKEITVIYKADPSIKTSFKVTVKEFPFKDVKEGTYYYEPVIYVNSRGIMTGLTPDTFGPAEKLSRAQFATVLYRMAGSPEVTGENKFKDVDENAFYTNAVIWASSEGIVTGYEDGRFGPADDITREQIATMFFRYSDYKGYNTSGKADITGYPDVDKVSSFAREAVEWAVHEEIIKGRQDGSIAPQAEASRADCATIIMRFMEKNK